MNKLGQVILGGGLILTVGAAQAVELSGNVTLATDYVYRGISQTGEAATVQGGFDLTTASGAYVGIWGSNVAFDGSVEIDYYAGYRTQISDLWGYDVGLISFDYPNQNSLVHVNSNFNEIYLKFSIKQLKVGIAHSNDFFAETGSATYGSLDYSLSLPRGVGLGFHYGYQDVDAGDSYEEHAISLSKQIKAVDYSLAWHDTDISSCNICESRLVLSMSKTL